MKCVEMDICSLFISTEEKLSSNAPGTSMLATMDHTEFAQMNIFTLQSGGTAISFVQELDRQ